MGVVVFTYMYIYIYTDFLHIYIYMSEIVRVVPGVTSRLWLGLLRAVCCCVVAAGWTDCVGAC